MSCRRAITRPLIESRAGGFWSPDFEGRLIRYVGRRIAGLESIEAAFTLLLVRASLKSSSERQPSSLDHSIEFLLHACRQAQGTNERSADALKTLGE